ncbi:MAG TPA: type II secretion system F family protein [Candidatus Ozemobacteraceae bacterium]|nr:type II secretion system F family protein [Candidatus Ozemobacteraceae bacterium]
MNSKFASQRCGSGLSTRVQVADDELMMLLWQIETALRSGATMERMLALAAEGVESETAKNLASGLSEDILHGIPFSIALNRRLHGCSGLVYAITAMGETAGRLDLAISVIRHMHDISRRWWREFDSWIINSPRMCATFWGVMILAACDLSAWQMQDSMYETRTPFVPRVVQTLASWSGEPLVWLLIGLLGLWYLIWRGRGGTGLGWLVRDAFRRLPWFGPFCRSRLAARCMRLLAFLLETGQSPFLVAAIIAETVDRPDVRTVFSASCKTLKNGGPLSQALSMSGLLPERALLTIATAEEVGTLPETVAWLAESYEVEVERKSAVIGGIFTVVMIVFQVGVLVVMAESGFDPFFFLAGF